ncbi:MAG: WD40 repeat domain-containing protein [Planctomycetota bacterium]
MTRLSRSEASEAWTSEGLKYARAVNEMVDFVSAHGWDAWKGEQPRDARSAELADRVVELLRDANAAGTVDPFRADFPPAHAPFAENLGQRGTDVAQLAWVDDARLAFVVGTPWTSQQGYVLDVDGERLTALEDVRGVGVSPDRKHFARVSSGGIEVRLGWEGPVTVRMAFPQSSSEDDPVSEIERCLVMPGGERVVTVTSEGIYSISASGAKLVHPEPDPDDEDWTPDIDMAHAAIAPDGELICVGDQSSMHRVLDAEGVEIASIGMASEYPHHAAFSRDGGLVAVNSCHLYDGGTIVVPTDSVHGLETEEFLGFEDLPSPCRLLDGGMRVYASDVLPGLFLFGDAGGYVRAISEDGELLWQHLVGSSISGIAVSPDGTLLAIGSSSGTLYVIALDQPQRDPFQIGTAPHVERRRWLFWRDLDRPLRW